MKTKLFAAILIASALATSPAIAREPVPIINHDNISVATNSGKTLQLEQVKQAIQAAAGAKAWTIAFQADGKLLATLHVRGKHTIVVEIAYAADKYSLQYRDSTNMKFGELNGSKVIHPFYNKWVLELKDAIRIELLKL
jgi:hypothetical protein